MRVVTSAIQIAKTCRRQPVRSPFDVVCGSPLGNRFAMNRFLVSGRVSVDVALAFLQPSPEHPESGNHGVIYSVGAGGGGVVSPGAVPAPPLLDPIIPGLRQQRPLGAVQLDGGQGYVR